MDFFRFSDLLDYWERFPPVHVATRNLRAMYAAVHGIKIEENDEGAIPADGLSPEDMLGLTGVKVDVNG